MTTSIPMVGPTADPVHFGWTTSLARPDRNFTGVVLDAGLDIWAKRGQLLQEIARKVTKLGYLDVNPAITTPIRAFAPPSKPQSELASRRLMSLSPERLIEQRTNASTIP